MKAGASMISQSRLQKRHETNVNWMFDKDDTETQAHIQ